MTKPLLAFFFFLSFLCDHAEAQCQERHGWVQPGLYPASVTRAPDPQYAVVGMIKPRAAVSVCDSIQGWVQLMPPAPVRDMKGAWVDCKPGCYMRGENFSTTFPVK
jgi:hypothetical protein